MFELLKDHFTKIIVQGHPPGTVEHLPLNEKRNEMRGQAFGTTLNSLERAYTKFLHVACEDAPSPELSAGVRNLYDSINGKLHANCLDAETADANCSRSSWSIHRTNSSGRKYYSVRNVLEEALDIARQEKGNAYDEVGDKKKFCSLYATSHRDMTCSDADSLLLDELPAAPAISMC